MAISEMVLGGLPPPEHHPASAPKHTPSLSEGEVSLLVLELRSEGWLQVWLTFSGLCSCF